MRYRVRGADRDSGAAVERVIEASDESDVRARASAAGLMVETLAVVAEATSRPPTFAVRVLSTVVDSGAEGIDVMRARLETMLNELAGDGWEFVSVQSIPALTLASHRGTSRISGEDVASNVCLAVFRRVGRPL